MKGRITDTVIYVAIGVLVLFGICSLALYIKDAPTKKTAESQETTDAETVTIRIFDKNVNGEAFDDEVAEEIMKKTGVNIEIEDASADPEDKAESMLQNRSYPDIVLLEQGDMVNRYIESDALICLDDLVKQYGSNIKKMYGDTLKKSRYTDGKLYWFANWYGKDTDASAGVLMRKDILTKIVGKKRAESHKPFTLSEYTEILRQFKEQFPVLEGHFSIPLVLDSDSDNYEPTMKGMFGLKTYEADKNNDLHYLPSSEQFRKATLYLNQLYDEELLDKEWVINKAARNEDKMSTGYVFSTWGSYWDTDEVNKELVQKYGKGSEFYCYKVVADDLSADETTYNGRNSLGWDAIGITDNCTDVEAAMKVLNYLASEEGQYLMLWGPEGKTWTRERGKHVPNETLLEKWQSYSETMEQTIGLRRWTWMIKNGNGSDGTPYDLTTKYMPSDVVKFANANFGESDYWDSSEFQNLEPTQNSKYGLQWQNILDIYDQYFTKIVCASTEEEAETLYDKMIDDMEMAGLEDCEKYITEEYQQRLSDWND